MPSKGKSLTEEQVKTWKKRIQAAKDLHEEWEKGNRVQDCYNYWRGEQLSEPFDANGNRRCQINKIHPEVRNNIPSLYYYRPFARLTGTPEQQDDPGTQLDVDIQLLQDTVNHLMRDPRTMYRDSTHLALKEAHWAMGVVEVGYTADFVDAPNVEKPELKEKKDTAAAKPLPREPEIQNPMPPPVQPPMPGPLAGELPQIPEMPPMGAPPPPPAPPGMDQMGLSVDGGSDLASLEAEIARLQAGIKSEKFFVKHIEASHILCSNTDRPIPATNDWIGYWEDVPLEDVMRSEAYENKTGLKANTGDDAGTAAPGEDPNKAYNEATGSIDKIRLYKIWDFRTREKLVFAEGHDKALMRKTFKREGALKFLRFDIDPYHFYPRPLILSKLGVQDEYNDSREYLRKIRKGTVPRYTYDEDGIDAKQLQKLESGEMGTYVPRKSGTQGVIEPVQQPSFSENAIQTLTLSDKEFADVGGVGNDAKIAATKTATQAKIAETKDQVQDSFDRMVVSEWLASIAEELLHCAIDNMTVDQWIAINVVPEGQFSMQLAQGVRESYTRISGTILEEAAAGVRWSVSIDIESMSPVSEEEKFQKWMTGLSLFANPPMARLFSVSPELLQHTLSLLGVKSTKDQQLILTAMLKVVQMEQQLAMMSQNAAPGMSGQPGGGAPPPKPGGGPPGGPQPGGPPGPGASRPGPGSAGPPPPAGAPPPPR